MKKAVWMLRSYFAESERARTDARRRVAIDRVAQGAQFSTVSS